MFEPFGQLVRIPNAKSKVPTGARLARVGVYLFWALIVIVVVARAALGSHLFAFAS